jgi:phosphoserine phosphatase RsbU/P
VDWSLGKGPIRSRMGIFTLFLIVVWLLRLVPAVRRALSPHQLVLDLTGFLLVIPAVYYTWKLFAFVKRELLWKIRRRLILAHIFIGVIPVILVLTILYVSALLFYYQLSYYLIQNQIGIHIAQAHALNLSLRSGMEQAMARSSTTPGVLRSVLERDGKYVLGIYPSASVILRTQDQATGRISVQANRSVKTELLGTYQLPRWTSDHEFSGLVVEDSQPELYRRANAADENGGRGRLFLRSLVFSDFRSDAPFSLELSVPLDEYLLDRLKAAVGQDLLLADHVPPSSLNVMLQNTDILRRNILSATFDMTDEQQSLGRPVWSILLFPVSWNTGNEEGHAATEVLFVELSTSKLMQNVFRSESNVSQTILGLLRIVLIFFLAIEVISLFVGIVLTRSITHAVHNLYRGTEFVKRGDFSHRIVVKSNDQLGALAKSFNQMTDYVQSLVKERVEKERLQRELEIAKEVQEQLFPREAPRMERMELTGLCLPARVVSGDYYDFLKLDAHNMGMALGDICGKGISAALLMANLQATLRSNVINLFGDDDAAAERLQEEGAVAQVVKMLNRQIYNFTASNKFASFFYGVYNDANTSLTYCNAGHNPPLYFQSGGFQRLSTGGTVVGIFPDAEYQQATLYLQPGDLLLAYTDGIVESVNEYGEEFGEQRLIQILEQNRQLSAREIQKVIVDQVLDWAFEEERDDDMTLIVAKIT